MWEAYSHEVSSCGYWPGPPGEEGVFYAYAYPEPPGFRDTLVARPRSLDDDLGEFVLPYEAVRTARIPTPCCSSSCRAPTTRPPTAGWDRRALERPNRARTMADTCTHLDTIADVTPSSDGCEDCLRIGGRWVHLRLCMRAATSAAATTHRTATPPPTGTRTPTTR